MSDSLLVKGKKLLENRILTKNVRSIMRNNKIILVSIMVVIFGLMLQLLDAQADKYAQAYTKDNFIAINKVQSPLFEEKSELFAEKANKIQPFQAKNKKDDSSNQTSFSGKLYEIVGDTPIKEMVPFISKRDKKVAAFLVGIARKESSWGEHSPLKNGQTCYNYWGYKGSAGNGSALGYACFGSAEEAVEIVGNRIETLVGKNRNTPASMVNTWKCGTSCKGDPGAPSWVSTVALYFNKIVG